MKQIKSMSLKKTALTAALAAALASTGVIKTAYADEYVFSFSGLFTMLDPTGKPLANTSNPYYSDKTWGYGLRTQITGTLTYCTDGNSCTGGRLAGQGSVTIAPFNFFNGTSPATATGISFQNIGNGTGGPGTLLLANMLFDWNGNIGIPVSIVWDATGMLGALGPTLSPGSVVTGTGVLPASNGIKSGAYPLGPAPVATTTWNTTLVGAACTGPNGASCMTRNPIGQLPLIADTIGGSPMVAGPFGGYNANFDLRSMTVSSKNGISGVPSVTSTLPTNGSTGFTISSKLSVTFTQNMDAATVASSGAFTVVETATSTPVPGTVSPSSGLTSSAFTFTPSANLKYSTQYTATLASSIQNVVGVRLASPYAWSFTTQPQPTGQACATPSALVPLGSNFTMLDTAGVSVEGGTNDIVYNLDFVNLNNSVAGTMGILTNTMASKSSYQFKGASWTAHHIRLFGGPGTYLINTACSPLQLEQGTCAPNPDATQNLKMIVGANQVGAHMLFDWNGITNIDVVNVWNKNAAWSFNGATAKGVNWITTSGAWLGPAGVSVDPNTTWDYVSTDNDADGINGVKMVDGPFKGFNANFNLSPHSSCVGTGVVPFTGQTSEGTKVPAGGCSISSLKVNPLERADWWLLAGFLAWLGGIRVRLKRKAIS